MMLSVTFRFAAACNAGESRAIAILRLQIAVLSFRAPANGAALGIQVKDSYTFAGFLGRDGEASGKRSFAAAAFMRCEYYYAH
jgi:hypothetical protein